MRRTFVGRIDHASLKYMRDQRIKTTAQQTWLAKLISYDFVIKYKPGKENKVADSLFRVIENNFGALNQCNKEVEGSTGKKCLAISDLVLQWLREIKLDYSASNYIDQLK